MLPRREGNTRRFVDTPMCMQRRFEVESSKVFACMGVLAFFSFFLLTSTRANSQLFFFFFLFLFPFPSPSDRRKTKGTHQSICSVPPVPKGICDISTPTRIVSGCGPNPPRNCGYLISLHRTLWNFVLWIHFLCNIWIFHNCANAGTRGE